MRNTARFATPALMLLPSALIVYSAFNAGGFFPGTTGFVAVILVQVLILRVLLIDRPFDGFDRTLTVAIVLFGLFTLWTAISVEWSDSPWRAISDFDRALLYLLALVLFGSVVATTDRLRWLVWGLAGGLFAVSFAALISRTLPDLWPTSANIANNRLSHPVTYWNALGIMTGIGFILCLHLTARARGPAVPRILGAAAIPVLAVTLYFTFSRGAILATIIGVVAYIAVGRPRGIFSALVATVPGTVIALVIAYGADVLATENPSTPEGVDQGKSVAVAVVLCMLAAAVLRFVALRFDARLARLEHVVAPRTARMYGGAAAACAVLLFVGLGGPGWIGDQYDRFADGSGETGTADLRDRLTDPGNNGRIDHWDVARVGFREDRLKGGGAGTYQLAWERERERVFKVVNAHGLYFETASELGVVGLVLLIGAILTILIGLLVRARGESRAVYAALFAVGLAWALHAGIDWDWEMPATTLAFFAAGAVALGARREPDPADPTLSNAWRTPIALGLAVVAVTPILVVISQTRLDDASETFRSGDQNCDKAIDQALSAGSILALRPEPYEILGYCQVAADFSYQGISAMEEALHFDPDNWEYHLGLAIAQAEAGLDPRPAAARASELNPGEPVTQLAVKQFASDDPAVRDTNANGVRNALFQANLLTLP